MSKEFTEYEDNKELEPGEKIWNDIYREVEEQGVTKIPEILNKLGIFELEAIAPYARDAHNLYKDEEHNQYLIEAPIAKAVVEKLNSLEAVVEKLNSLEAAYPIHKDDIAQTNPNLRSNSDVIPAPVAPAAHEKERDPEFTENPLRNRIAPKIYGDEEHNPHLIETPIAKALFEKLNSLEAAYPIHKDDIDQTNPNPRSNNIPEDDIAQTNPNSRSNNIPEGDVIPAPVAPVAHEKEIDPEFTENPLRNRITPTKKPSLSAPVTSVEEYSNYSDIEKDELEKTSHTQKITDQKIERKVANRWAQVTAAKLNKQTNTRQYL